MDGKVVFFKIFDLGGMVDFRKLKKIAESSATRYPIHFVPDLPYLIQPPSYCIVNVEPRKIQTSVGKIRIEPKIKVFSIGAISITYSIEFSRLSLPELSRFSQIKLERQGSEFNLDTLLKEIFSEISTMIKPAMYDRYETSVPLETHTIFCITKCEKGREGLLAKKKEIASLLLNEEPQVHLSEAEINDTISMQFSHEKDDLIIIDWDAALIFQKEGKFDNLLIILEIANLMLLELKSFDQYLSKILDRAYKDVDLLFMKKLKYSSAKEKLRDLINTRIDLLKMSDELTNTTKFVGEWYLAKIYGACVDKFHIKDWEKSVSKKLSTLQEQYLMLNNALEGRKMMMMELSIIILFILDLILLVVPFLID